MDFLTKELVDTFTYTTMNQDRTGEYDVNINGRTYTKYGTYQAVTMVGNLYKVFDPSTNNYKRVLMVGVAKQHPCDTLISKEEAYEVANTNAMINPTIVMEIGYYMGNYEFNRICESHINTLKLSFIKTRDEILGEQYYKAMDQLIHEAIERRCDINNNLLIDALREHANKYAHAYINKFNR